MKTKWKVAFKDGNTSPVKKDSIIDIDTSGAAPEVLVDGAKQEPAYYTELPSRNVINADSLWLTIQGDFHFHYGAKHETRTAQGGDFIENATVFQPIGTWAAEPQR